MPTKLLAILFYHFLGTVFVAGVHSLRLLVDLPFLPPTSRRRAILYTTSSISLIVSGGGSGLLPRANAATKSRVDGYTIQTIDGYEWIDVLTSGQYFVLRQGGTEPPNSSPLASEKRRGVYVCAGCVAPLFDSTNKFDSGTGWPSFVSPRREAVETLPTFANLLGSEVRCQRCGGHLGDVYSDGDKFPSTAAEVTGKRYCINGSALVFVPSEEDAKPVVGDGLSGRKKLLFNKNT